MHPKPHDLKVLISKYRSMNIEALKAKIDHWEEETNFSNQFHHLDIAKKELDLKYKERKQQLELLTKSLSSSSRILRWISSAKSVLKQFIKLKN